MINKGDCPIDGMQCNWNVCVKCPRWIGLKPCKGCGVMILSSKDFCSKCEDVSCDKIMKPKRQLKEENHD